MPIIDGLARVSKILRPQGLQQLGQKFHSLFLVNRLTPLVLNDANYRNVIAVLYVLRV